MTDEHDQLMDALFAVARRELPSQQARARTLRAAARRRPRRRWFALLAAALAACFGVALSLAQRHPPVSPPISAEAARRERARPTPKAGMPAAGESDIAQKLSPAPAVTEEKRARPRPTAAAEPLTLEQELGVLDQVRREASTGNPRVALALLDDYERRAKSGNLRSEAELLRIQALSKMGDGARAAKLARKFVETYPNSPLVDRARRLAAPTADGSPDTSTQEPKP